MVLLPFAAHWMIWIITIVVSDYHTAGGRIFIFMPAHACADSEPGQNGYVVIRYVYISANCCYGYGGRTDAAEAGKEEHGDGCDIDDLDDLTTNNELVTTLIWTGSGDRSINSMAIALNKQAGVMYVLYLLHRCARAAAWRM